MSNVKFKKLLTMVSVVIAGLFLLTGCGKAEIPNGYYKLSSVNQSGDFSNPFGTLDDNSYIVFTDGKGYIVLKGTPEDITYDVETGIAHTSFGDIPASVDGDTFILADKNFKMFFDKSSDPAPAKPDYPAPPEPEVEEAAEEPAEESTED